MPEYYPCLGSLGSMARQTSTVVIGYKATVAVLFKSDKNLVNLKVPCVSDLSHRDSSKHHRLVRLDVIVLELLCL